tara:strand:- start:238 stop:420 length:183 start_codon:yes stop_codon:yes gene_type:complete
MSEKEFSSLTYLKHMLSVDGDFLQEFKRLDPVERADLRKAAIKEMKYYGIKMVNIGEDDK